MEILTESLVRSTLIAAVVALVLKAARVASPSVRHAAWTGVVIVMLMLPALAAWGPRAPVRLLPADGMDGRTLALSRAVTETAATLSPRSRAAKQAEGRNSAAFWSWRALAAGAYAVGLAVLLIRL